MAAVALCDRQPHGLQLLGEVDVRAAIPPLLVWSVEAASHDVPHVRRERAAALARKEPAAIRTLEAPLIRRAQAGDSNAVGQLYERHEGQVRRYLASRLGSGHAADIDDLVAETFLTAMQRMGAFELERPGAFGCWLIGIARNKLLNWYGHRSRREITSDEPWAAAGARGIVPAPDEAVSPED